MIVPQYPDDYATKLCSIEANVEILDKITDEDIKRNPQNINQLAYNAEQTIEKCLKATLEVTLLTANANGGTSSLKSKRELKNYEKNAGLSHSHDLASIYSKIVKYNSGFEKSHKFIEENKSKLSKLNNFRYGETEEKISVEKVKLVAKEAKRFYNEVKSDYIRHNPEVDIYLAAKQEYESKDEIEIKKLNYHKPKKNKKPKNNSERNV